MMDYRKKNRILGVVFFGVLFVVYQFAIKRTLDYKAQYHKLVKEKTLLDNASYQIKKLQKRNNQLDAILHNDNVTISNSFEQVLLKKIDDYSKIFSLDIIALDEPQSVAKNNIKTFTYTLKLRGDYVGLLNFLSSFEKSALGNIISVKYLKENIYMKRKKQLYLEIVFTLVK